LGQPSGRSVAGKGQRLTSNGDRLNMQVSQLAVAVIAHKPKNVSV
jgi:hypothetical protein